MSTPQLIDACALLLLRLFSMAFLIIAWVARRTCYLFDFVEIRSRITKYKFI
jgi:hypothetical protein